MKKILSIIMIVTILITLIGCQKTAPMGENTPKIYTEIGEGKRELLFSVTDNDGKTESFLVHTDKEIVGDALKELGMIDGEDGAYGLYVKVVNGIEADFDKDKCYWAFYIDGEYATSGVDKTKIEDDKNYAFRIEK